MSRHALLHLLAVVVLALLLLVAVRLHSAAAATIDPHALYERACATCHPPHSRDLAQQSVKRVDGRTVGVRSGRPIVDLLAAHMGVELTAEQRAALAGHFEAMLATGFLFREKCIVCHDRAHELARLRLQIHGGRLVGRYSGLDIAKFLEGHGRLEGGEVAIMVATLRRQLEPRGEVLHDSALPEDKGGAPPTGK
jgi:cytochrome c5